MVKHSTPDVVCMRVERVSNIITQLTRAMEDKRMQTTQMTHMGVTHCSLQ